MILTIKTDKPDAEVGLFDPGGQQQAYKKWTAHRQLGATIHLTVKELLDSINKDWSDISGVVFYKGPGSFTGLRIGASVANALASANAIPLASTSGQKWVDDGLKALAGGHTGPALPEYGGEPHTTKPRK